MLSEFYKQEKIERTDKYIVFVMLVVLCITPIITYKYISMVNSPIPMDNKFGTGIKADIFNFYKAIIVYLGTGMIFSLFIYKISVLKYTIKPGKFNILLAILSIGIVFSVLFSQYKSIELMGNFDRSELALSWLCYIIILFVLYNTKIENKYFKTF